MRQHVTIGRVGRVRYSDALEDGALRLRARFLISQRASEQNEPPRCKGCAFGMRTDEDIARRERGEHILACPWSDEAILDALAAAGVHATLIEPEPA